MEFINRMRKDKKGFTLVEIIVVLVILAILAAFTIPAMLGFVGDARAKAYLAEAREVYTAAQATATEISAKETITDAALSTALGSTAVQPASAAIADADAASLKASKQMYKYINSDLTISNATAANLAADTVIATTVAKSNSGWLVTVGDATDATSKTGKVTSVVYIKGGYSTTVYGDGKDPITVKLPTSR